MIPTFLILTSGVNNRISPRSVGCMGMFITENTKLTQNMILTQREHFGLNRYFWAI